MKRAFTLIELLVVIAIIAVLIALLLGFLLLAVLLALVPLSNSYTIGVVGEILVFAIFAMSLDLLIGYVGLMSFAHSAFFGLAAYSVVAKD